MKICDNVLCSYNTVLFPDEYIDTGVCRFKPEEIQLDINGCCEQCDRIDETESNYTQGDEKYDFDEEII